MNQYDSVEEYISKIPGDKKDPFKKLRQVILDHLPTGFQEEISHGMIGYVIPKYVYPAGYHTDPEKPLPLMHIACQKNNITFYHMGIYADLSLLSWFSESYKKICSHKIDLGKSCIRFKYLDEIPYDLIGELVSKISVKQWIKMYEDQIK